MARRSDVILLVRIKEHMSPQNPDGPNTTYAQSVESCELLKTFKGELAEGSTVTIHLFDGDYALPDRFRRRSCHVVFLSDRLQTPAGPIARTPEAIATSASKRFDGDSSRPGGWAPSQRVIARFGNAL